MTQVLPSGIEVKIRVWLFFPYQNRVSFQAIVNRG